MLAILVLHSTSMACSTCCAEWVGEPGTPIGANDWIVLDAAGGAFLLDEDYEEVPVESVWLGGDLSALVPVDPLVIGAEYLLDLNDEGVWLSVVDRPAHHFPSPVLRTRFLDSRYREPVECRSGGTPVIGYGVCSEGEVVVVAESEARPSTDARAVDLLAGARTDGTGTAMVGWNASSMGFSPGSQHRLWFGTLALDGTIAWTEEPDIAVGPRGKPVEDVAIGGVSECPATFEGWIPRPPLPRVHANGGCSTVPWRLPGSALLLALIAWGTRRRAARGDLPDRHDAAEA